MLDKPLTAAVRFEFQVDLKAVQHTITRSREHPSRLCQTLVMAHQLQSLLAHRQAGSMVKLAKWLKLGYSRLNQIMSLLYLAPEIQEQILCAKEKGVRVLSENDVRPIVSELDWRTQRRRWESLIAYQRELTTAETGSLEGQELGEVHPEGVGELL